MCRAVSGKSCGKTTWAGCGQHVEQVMRGVLRRTAAPATPGSTTAGVARSSGASLAAAEHPPPAGAAGRGCGPSTRQSEREPAPVSLLAVPLGLLIGVALGALGGGGSILTVPALVYVLGQDPRTATTSSLLIVGVTALIAVLPHARAGRVRFGQGLLFGALGAVGSFAGSALSAHVPAQVLLSGFAALMLLVATLMLRRASGGGSAGSGGLTDLTIEPMLTLRPLTCACPRVAKVLATASAVGLLTGFFGVGGGFALVPALVLALGYPMPVAVGTSLLVIAVNSATALAARTGTGDNHLDWAVTATFTAAAIVGSLIGGRITSRANPRHLTRAFAALLILIAVYTAARSLPALI